MTQYVGIDVSKAVLDVYLLPEETARQFPRDEAGLRALSEWLGSLELGTVVMEASGGYEQSVVAALAAAGLPVVVVNALGRCVTLPGHWAFWPRPTASMRG